MPRAKSGPKNASKDQTIQSVSNPDIRVRQSFLLSPDVTIRLKQEMARLREARLDGGDPSELSDSDAMNMILDRYLPERRR